MNRVLRQFSFLAFAVLLLIISNKSTAQGPSSEGDLKKQAEKYFDEEDFTNAYPLYSQLLSLYPDDPIYNYRLGTCMLFSKADKERPVSYLELSIKKPGIDKLAYYYLGRAYHLNYRFDEAIKIYQQFQQTATSSELKKHPVDHLIQMCNDGKTLLKDVHDLDVLEKKELSLSDYYHAYDLSANGGTTLIEPDDFKSKLDKKKQLNSVIYLSPDRTDVFYSSYGDNEENGKDIYEVKRLPTGGFSKPTNLGTIINTPYDEDYPFYDAPTHTLYFSSKGHNSMGGYDVFKSVYNASIGVWSTPVNMDFPINTPDDDILFIADTLGQTAFFASARSSPEGTIDIYKIKIQQHAPTNVLLKGIAFTDNGKTPTACTITVKNYENGKTVGVYNSSHDDGGYFMNLPNGTQLVYSVEAAGHPTESVPVLIPKEEELVTLKQEIGYDSATDKLIITNHFESAGLNADYLLALDYIKSKAKMEVNIDTTAPSVTNNATSNPSNQNTSQPVTSNNNLTFPSDNNSSSQNNNVTQANNNSSTNNSTTAQNNNSSATNNPSNNNTASAQNNNPTTNNPSDNNTASSQNNNSTTANNPSNNSTSSLQNNNPTTNNPADNNSSSANTANQNTSPNNLTASSNSINDPSNTNGNISNEQLVKTATNDAQQDEQAAETSKENSTKATEYANDKLQEAQNLNNEAQKITDNAANITNTKQKKDSLAKATSLRKQADEASKKADEVYQIAAQEQTDASSKQKQADESKQYSISLDSLSKTPNNSQAVAQLKTHHNNLKQQQQSEPTTSVTAGDLIRQQAQNTKQDSTEVAKHNDELKQEVNSLEDKSQDYINQAQKTDNAQEKVALLQQAKDLSESKKRKQQEIEDNQKLEEQLHQQYAGQINEAKTADNTTKISAQNGSPVVSASDAALIKQEIEHYTPSVPNNAVASSQSNNNNSTPNTNTSSQNNASNSSVASTNNPTNTDNNQNNQQQSSNNATSNSQNNQSSAQLVTSNTNSANQNSSTQNSASSSNNNPANNSNNANQVAANQNTNSTQQSSASQPNNTDNTSPTVQYNTTAGINKVVSTTSVQYSNLTASEASKTAIADSIESQSLTTKANDTRLQARQATGPSQARLLSQKADSLDNLAQDKSLQSVMAANRASASQFLTNKQQLVAWQEAIKNNNSDRITTAQLQARDANFYYNKSLIEQQKADSTNKPYLKQSYLDNASKYLKTALLNQQGAKNIYLSVDPELTSVAPSTTTTASSNQDIQQNSAVDNSASQSNNTALVAQNNSSTNNVTKLTNNPSDNNQVVQNNSASNPNTTNNTNPVNNANPSNNNQAAQNNSASNTNLANNTSTVNNTNPSDNNQVGQNNSASNPNVANNTNPVNNANPSNNNQVAQNNSASNTNATNNTSAANNTNPSNNNQAAQNNSASNPNTTNNINPVNNTNPSNNNQVAQNSTTNNPSNSNQAAQNNSNSTNNVSSTNANSSGNNQTAANNTANTNNVNSSTDNNTAQNNSINNSNPSSAQEAKKIDSILSANNNAANQNASVNNNRNTNSPNSSNNAVAQNNSTSNSTNPANTNSAQNNSTNTSNNPDNTNQTGNNSASQNSANNNVANNSTSSNNNSSNSTQIAQNNSANNPVSPNNANTAKNSANPSDNNQVAQNNSSANPNSANTVSNTNPSDNSASNRNATNNSNTVSNTNPSNNNQVAQNNSLTSSTSNSSNSQSAEINNSSAQNSNPSTTPNSLTISLTEDIFAESTASPYSINKPIPIDPPLPEGLVFKVQIGAFRNSIPQNLFKGIQPVTGEKTASGLTRYMAGIFKELPGAKKAQTKIRELGFKDAFVVAFYNGKRISLAEALARQGGNAQNANTTVANQPSNNTIPQTQNNNATVNNSTQVANTNPVTQQQPANTNTTVVNDVKGLFFSVQVGAYQRPVPSSRLYNLSPLFSYNAPNGYIRYNCGIYSNLPKASSAKKDIILKTPIKDAFIVAYSNGERIGITQAAQLLSNGGGSVPQNPNLDAMPNSSSNNSNIIPPAPQNNNPTPATTTPPPTNQVPVINNTPTPIQDTNKQSTATLPATNITPVINNSSTQVPVTDTTKQPTNPITNTSPVNSPANTSASSPSIATRNLSSSSVAAAGDITISVTIRRGTISGFAKLEETIPNGFTASEGDKHNSTFKFEDGTLSYVWTDLPSDSAFTVTYKLTALSTVSGQQTLTGKFLYLVNSEKQETPIAPSVITISGNNNTVNAPSNTISTSPTANTNTPTIDTTNKKVSFCVQVGAYSGPIPIDMANKLLKISSQGIKAHKEENGTTSYTVGNYPDYTSADLFKQELAKDGYPQAFVVAYSGGKKISLQEAQLLINK